MVSLFNLSLVLLIIGIGFGLLFIAVRSALVAANTLAEENPQGKDAFPRRDTINTTPGINPPQADLLPVRTLALAALLLASIILLLVVVL